MIKPRSGERSYVTERYCRLIKQPESVHANSFAAGRAFMPDPLQRNSHEPIQVVLLNGNNVQ